MGAFKNTNTKILSSWCFSKEYPKLLGNSPVASQRYTSCPSHFQNSPGGFQAQFHYILFGSFFNLTTYSVIEYPCPRQISAASPFDQRSQRIYLKLEGTCYPRFSGYSIHLHTLFLLNVFNLHDLWKYPTLKASQSLMLPRLVVPEPLYKNCHHLFVRIAYTFPEQKIQATCQGNDGTYWKNDTNRRRPCHRFYRQWIQCV